MRIQGDGLSARRSLELSQTSRNSREEISMLRDLRSSISLCFLITVGVCLGRGISGGGAAHAAKPGGGGGGGSSPLHFNLTFVGDLGGGYSSADGLNNLGDVVGWSFPTANSAEHGFLWSAAMGTVDVNG